MGHSGHSTRRSLKGSSVSERQELNTRRPGLCDPRQEHIGAEEREGRSDGLRLNPHDTALVDKLEDRHPQMAGPQGLPTSSVGWQAQTGGNRISTTTDPGCQGCLGWRPSSTTYRLHVPASYPTSLDMGLLL